MKYFLIIFGLFVTLNCNAQDLNTLRKNFPLALDNKSLCENMISNLSKTELSQIELAYLGAYQTLWANHVFSPISKLNTFRKGRKNIDNAIKKNPNSLEVRFIRYSIQKNAPKFLGYSDHLKSDEEFLRNNINQVESPTLKEMIKNILK